MGARRWEQEAVKYLTKEEVERLFAEISDVRDLLLFDHHEVEVAHDGAEGIALARRYHPDVVLCDVGLPGMDGYQVARAFRASDELRSTYMVAITGYAMRDDNIRAIRAGFDRHMAKPPDYAELGHLLAEMPL